MIEPRTLKGFRDYLPDVMIPRERLMETARRVYRSYGFSPIDTPALEFEEILIGKGGGETEKQMYRFPDAGGRQVAMRFDLTVPLARFAAQHLNELGLPFKRYHIATVWRGEKPAAGRFREFMQCDFDTIGTLSPAADIETALVIHDLLLAIGFTDFKIHINNRMVLNGMLERFGLADRSAAVLRALDKLHKIGSDGVAAEMRETAGTTDEQARDVLQLAELSDRKTAASNDEILRKLAPLVAGNDRGETGVARLAELLAAVKAAGVPESRLRLDVAIARGLDYYTGTIFETFLDQLPDGGSICSGGRYDNLAELYTSQKLPGIGASLGLDRLLAYMEQLGMLPKVVTPAEVFIPYFDAARLHDYLRLAAQVRRGGFGVEVYPDPKKLGQQLKYADRRGFRVAIVAGQNELEAGTVQVKNLATATSETVRLDPDASELLAVLRRLLM
jgi:histidyl-tRNA synthetase